MTDPTVLPLTKPFPAEVLAWLENDVAHSSDNIAFLYDSQGALYRPGPNGIPPDSRLYLTHGKRVIKTLCLPGSFPPGIGEIVVDKTDDLYVYGGIQSFTHLPTLGWFMLLVEPPRPWPEEATPAYRQYRAELRQAIGALRTAHDDLLELIAHNPLAKRDTEEPPLKRPRTDAATGDAM